VATCPALGLYWRLREKVKGGFEKEKKRGGFEKEKKRKKEFSRIKSVWGML